MSYRLQINVTKEILEKSKYCSTDKQPLLEVGTNCAIALAIRQLFPEAWIYPNKIQFFYNNETGGNVELTTPLPIIAQNFILRFDSFVGNYLKRLDMEPISFEIEVPDQIIESIGISEVETILKDCPTMELIA